MQNLPGKTAFVTGGASGIGLGIAKALLGAGMNVVIADIRDDHLRAANGGARDRQRVLALKLDVTNRAEFARAADAAEARFGKIHLLCNNAGVAVVGPTDLATYADWDWVMGVNLGGTINGIVTMLPRIMQARRRRTYRQYRLDVGSDAAPGRDHLRHVQGRRRAHDGMHARRTRTRGNHLLGLLSGRRAIQHCRSRQDPPRASLSDTGYAEADKRRQQGGNFFHLYRTKEQVGERVLQGILNDELYIMTHSEFRQGVEDRAQAMCAAVPNLPENQEYKSTFSVLFRNPIHAAEIARQKGLKS